MGHRDHETASHDVTHDNVTWAIRIYPRASIEQVSSHFVSVHDDDWLTGCIKIDEVTCREGLTMTPRQDDSERERTDRMFFAILRT